MTRTFWNLIFAWKSKSIITLLLSVFCLCTNAQSKTELSIGNTIEFESSILNETRKLNIYIPSDLDSTKKYSIIYLLDGSIDEDFIHVVGLVQFFNMTFQMPPSIVVGIANVDRKRDFTFPTKDTSLNREFPTAGHSDKFISFIEYELQPYIADKFPVGPEKILIGQSLGGLLACEILLTRPHLFNTYLITSPSLWWDNQSLLKNCDQYLNIEFSHTPDVYISVGQEEHKVMIRDAKALYQKIKKQNSFDEVHFKLMPKENHATILHNSLYYQFSKILSK
jgi:predicted alpha/beta superfamily hydrolase